MLRKGFLIYCLLFLFSVIIYSCCREEITITGSGELAIITLETGHEIDTIRGPFGLRYSAEHIIAVAAVSEFLPTAHATSCEPTVVNPFVDEKFSLQVNRTLLYEGDTIWPGTNLLNVLEMGPSFLHWPYRDFNFDQNVIGKTHLENGSITFTLNGETEDGLMLEVEKEIYWEM